MKTSFSIRTIALSLFALAAFTFASKSFAAVDAFLWFEDTKGTIIKVPVQADGSYTTSAMKAGTYEVSLVMTDASSSGAKSATLAVTGAPGGSTSMSSGGDRPMESLSLNFTKITWNYEVKAPRDMATGQASGKRQHKPMNVTMSQSERLLPTVNKKLGSIVLDEDCDDGITGNIIYKGDNGQAVKPGYNVKANVK